MGWIERKVAGAWDTWRRAVQRLRNLGLDLAEQLADVNELQHRAGQIADPEARRVQFERLAVLRETVLAGIRRYEGLRSKGAWLSDQLGKAVDYFVPGYRSTHPAPELPVIGGGVGFVVTVPAALAAVAAVGALAAAVGVLAYYVGKTRRNVDAEAKVVNAALAGQLPPEDAATLLDGLNPPQGGGLFAGVSSGLVTGALLLGGLYYLSQRTGTRRRR